MHFVNTLAFLSTFVAVGFLPPLASACEGACITNTTNKYIEKFETPLKTIMDYTNSRLVSHFDLPPSANYLASLLEAYNRNAFDAMENAIFPSYFHGKCLQHTTDGTPFTPPGCPNPDCPVVCGTPGSMVHFFPVLRNITVNTHESIFALLIKQDSKSFQDVKINVRDAMPPKERPKETSARAVRSFSRSFAAHFPRSYGGVSPRQNDATFDKELYDILQLMVQKWSDVCDAQNDYVKCSWEKEMKAFILSFP